MLCLFIEKGKPHLTIVKGEGDFNERKLSFRLTYPKRNCCETDYPMGRYQFSH